MKNIFKILLLLSLVLAGISSHARIIVLPLLLVGAELDAMLRQLDQPPLAPGEEANIVINRQIPIPDDAIGAINRLRELIQREEQILANPGAQQHHLNVPMARAALDILRAELAAEEKRAADEEQEDEKIAADEEFEKSVQSVPRRQSRNMGKPGNPKTPRRKY